MSEVHAPYHFVPLSKWIYMPDWAHLVSHDVPFKDGYSGVLEYTLTNTTPLCVGGEQEQREGKPSLVKWAKDPMGNPVIPGSSLKGMIRSVLEIGSFGKFSAIDDSHFSYRDVSPTKGSDKHYLNDIKNKEVKAGWIKYNKHNDEWTITLCDFAKISHNEIKTSLGKTIANAENAIDKYHKIPLDKEVSVNISQPKGVQKNRWAEGVGEGSIAGSIVFCNERVGDGNDYEFSYCFFNKNSSPSITGDEINKQVHKLFTSHDEKQIEYLQTNPSKEHGIPVFALFDKKNKKLHSLGLAKMPRMLYKNSVSDLAKHTQKEARTSQHYFDMSELIFGTLRDRGFGLKSRVIFSDAITPVKPDFSTSLNVVLNSPKATFLGAYLEQASNSTEYQDYNDSDAELAGWKRYIVRNKLYVNDPSSNNSKGDNFDVQSQIELIAPENKFDGKIIFNNLKPEELGALIWALQLGSVDQSSETYHSLGHGKSLGAGSVQIRLKPGMKITPNNSNNSFNDHQSFVTTFIDSMENAYPGTKGSQWGNSAQIKHLLAISDQEENYHRKISHHTLDDFSEFKNKKSSLVPITSYGDEISRLENINTANYAPLSFNKGRLAGLIIEETESEQKWRKDITSNQEGIAAKYQLTRQKEQASLISNPNEKILAELELISTQFQVDLTKTQKKDVAKQLRGLTKYIKELAWNNGQIISIKGFLTNITISEKDKLIKWLNNNYE